MNAFTSSRHSSHVLDHQQLIAPEEISQADKSDELENELKDIKGVEKKYNVVEAPRYEQQNPRSWVKYLIYAKHDQEKGSEDMAQNQQVGDSIH